MPVLEINGNAMGAGPAGDFGAVGAPIDSQAESRRFALPPTFANLIGAHPNVSENGEVDH